MVFICSMSILLAVGLPALGAESNYTYDDLNQLIRLEKDDGTVIEYRYDASGNRTRMISRNSAALKINDVALTEGNSGSKNFVFTIALTVKKATNVTVKYATANGSATGGNDYTSASGMLTFTPGQTSKSLPIAVKGDTEKEPDEVFYVNLSSPTGASIADGQGKGTIINDDGASNSSLWGVSNLVYCSDKTKFAFSTTIDGVKQSAIFGASITYRATTSGIKTPLYAIAASSCTNNWTGTGSTISFIAGKTYKFQLEYNSGVLEIWIYSSNTAASPSNLMDNQESLLAASPESKEVANSPNRNSVEIIKGYPLIIPEVFHEGNLGSREENK